MSRDHRVHSVGCADFFETVMVVEEEVQSVMVMNVEVVEVVECVVVVVVCHASHFRATVLVVM